MTRLHPPLCDELGIEYPILSVGFGFSAGPELVSAVSEAGGCGVLGGSGVPPEEIEGRIARVRELTDRPFGFNMIIADFEAPDSTDEDRAYVGEQISVAVEARVPLIVDPTTCSPRQPVPPCRSWHRSSSERGRFLIPGSPRRGALPCWSADRSARGSHPRSAIRRHHEPSGAERATT